MKQYYVYILASKSRALYIGVTHELQRRIHQHKTKAVEGFTPKYDVNQLVYFETTPNILAALAREKELKGWLRIKKIALIEKANPTWEDLSKDWFS